jgi:succinate dehydrogenase hydrophobic anchor subunit
MQNEIWFRPLVWMDYRLALLFTVVIPLVLVIWAFVQKAEAIQRLLAIYWRVSSLLAITVYLFVAGMSVGFVTGLLARLLIPISLWFWVDLNEEIDDQPTSLIKLVFTSWRWAVTVYGILGALAQIPFLQCVTFTSSASPFCHVWLEPTSLYASYVHPHTKPQFLGFLAIVALIIYGLYFSYFILVRLNKQGRSAIQQ